MADLTAAEVVEMSVLHPRIKREQRDARILAMRDKGETLQAIGDELGLTRARVQQICADSKMPERDLLSWLEATAAYISTPLGMPALGKKISRVSATVADLIEDRDALLTREAALVAESEALKDERDQLNSDYLTAINAAKFIAAERDALSAEVVALQENAAAERSRGIMDAQDLLHEISSKHRSAAATAYAQELLNALMQKYAETQAAARAPATIGGDAT